MSTDGSGELTKRRPLAEWQYAQPDERNAIISRLTERLEAVIEAAQPLVSRPAKICKPEVTTLRKAIALARKAIAEAEGEA